MGGVCTISKRTTMKERQQSVEFHRNYCVHYDPQDSKCATMPGFAEGHAPHFTA